jgi:hypothetical protein
LSLIRSTILPLLSASLAFSACNTSDNNNTRADAADTAHECSNIATVDTLPASLREASGIAASRHYDGILWAHNDSDNPLTITALDTLARAIRTIRINTPYTDSDWEDIAVSRCGDVDCIYLADIGDNYATRSVVRILRFAEPDPTRDSVATPTAFPFRFPDGRHDAEAVVVLPGERIFVITKGRNAPVALFRYPGALRDDTVVLLHVRDFSTGIVQLPEMVTGASASADGRIVAVRTYSFLQLFTPHDSTDLVAAGHRISLAAADEFQGEGVTIASHNRLFLLGEKGLDTLAPRLSRLVCTLK